MLRVFALVYEPLIYRWTIKLLLGIANNRLFPYQLWMESNQLFPLIAALPK
jgi:hypothetical protein